MIHVDDDYYDSSYFEKCYEEFEKNDVFSRCNGMRFAVYSENAAKWLAFCFFIKSKGASLLPLPMGTPKVAAENKAKNSGSHYLIYSEEGDFDCLQKISEFEVKAEAGLVQMSSGTSGDPKFIRRSWDSIDKEVESYIEHFSEADDMTPIVACPVNHSYGLICGVFVALKRGLEPVVVRNNNPKYLIKKLRTIDNALLYSSPTLISTISMLARDEHFYAVMTSGTSIQEQWFEKIKKAFSHVYQQYGCSEAGCVSLAKDIQHVTNIGKPLPHLKVTTGKDASDRAEITVELHGGELIKTNDLGFFDDTGNMHFVSRLDDMINVSGLNVYPAEVENTVLEYPGLLDAVIYKQAHKFGSDQVCLNYVSNEEISASELRLWCGERLAKHQVPMTILRVAEIPRMPNGKISRKKIAEAHSK